MLQAAVEGAGLERTFAPVISMDVSLVVYREGVLVGVQRVFCGTVMYHVRKKYSRFIVLLLMKDAVRSV
jgi:hypothetical protein